MKLSDLKSRYYNGMMEKQNYIKEMHQKHQTLFEYSKFIRGTDIKSITISDDNVVMTSRLMDIKIICDPIDERIAPIEILNFNYYEKADFEMVLKLIKDDMTIFDIGANIGWYTINLSKIYSRAHIYAFEPIPKTFDYLTKNVALNELSNVSLLNFGFSDKDEKIDFYYYPEGSANASLINVSENKNVEKIISYVRKMDAFIKENKLHLDFIKCDVEGAELFVFRGGINAIERDRPIIFTELLRKWSAKFNYHPNELIVLLKNMGYRCFAAKEGKLIEFFTMTEETKESTFFFLHTMNHKDLIDKYHN
ncbi:MAG: FkbM family methyltransferase [Methanoregula sp.]